MATLKLSYWPKPQVALVSNEAIVLTIQYWPKVEMVLIVATGVIGRRIFIT